MKRTLLILSAFVLTLTPATFTATAASVPVAGNVDLTVAAERAVNSVVYIKAVTNSRTQTVPYRDPFEDFFGFGDFFGRGGGTRERKIETPKRTGTGSGVILTADGYIVTNNHVVENADELTVKLTDNQADKARSIDTEATTAPPHIKDEAKTPSPITVGSSDKLKLGEWVLAIGNPFSLTSTVTAGIVSAKARTLGAKAGSIESFIQTDAAINPGNSGGALVNAEGELVGINTMIMSQTGSYSGYGFAIPTSIMNKVIEDLKTYGTVQRALIGIRGTEVRNQIDAEKEQGRTPDYGTVNGIYVTEVTADGAAEEAGLRKGDVITAIDGKEIQKFGELQESIVNHRPGDKVKVTYLRDKKEHTVTLTLRNAQGTTTALKNLDTEAMGAALRPLTDKEKEELNLSSGLLITAIRDGKFKEAGLTKGLIIVKINDREMKTVEDFEDVVKQANLSSERVLWIRAKTLSGITRSFAVELSDPETKNSK